MTACDVKDGLGPTACALFGSPLPVLLMTTTRKRLKTKAVVHVRPLWRCMRGPSRVRWLQPPKETTACHLAKRDVSPTIPLTTNTVFIVESWNGKDYFRANAHSEVFRADDGH